MDESLLQTPEDEIDFAKVALKDIILFADYKERLAVHIFIFYFFKKLPYFHQKLLALEYRL